MKVIIENKIPFIKGLLEPIVDNVTYLSPDEITNEALRDADALITRTRTRCDARLLDGTACKFIATATIGTDHIDLNYCKANGITVANAPGCNAPAVAQYVFGSIAMWRKAVDDRRPLSSLTIGIVGVGHVGSIVERWARQLGMKVLLCDPPRAEREGDAMFTDMASIARQADVITFHTPMARQGAHPTFHLLDGSFTAALGRKPLVINSSRGPVTDTQSLIDALDSGAIGAAAIDCWENEPAISRPLLEKALIATPHIAGYSREGKIRATTMEVNALTTHFNLPPVEMHEKVAPGAAESVTLEAIAESYTPAADTLSLKENPERFEQLRNTYDYRHEVM